MTWINDMNLSQCHHHHRFPFSAWSTVRYILCFECQIKQHIPTNVCCVVFSQVRDWKSMDVCDSTNSLRCAAVPQNRVRERLGKVINGTACVTIWVNPFMLEFFTNSIVRDYCTWDYCTSVEKKVALKDSCEYFCWFRWVASYKEQP